METIKKRRKGHRERKRLGNNSKERKEGKDGEESELVIVEWREGSIGEGERERMPGEDVEGE